MKRFAGIDITRGLVMVIMALDHVRDFMHTTALTQSPTDLQTTTGILFFTRWITHLCAPTFVFLSGISAYLMLKRSKDIRQARSFLLTRGIWLVILDITFINFALWYDIHFRFVILEVISAIGFSFIILSFLLKLKSRTIGLIGLIIIFTHNLLQLVPVSANPAVVATSAVLFKPSLLQISKGFSMFTAYPVIPWLGIMLAGFGCGELFEKEQMVRKKFFLVLGTAAIGLFIIIRFINVYGDPAPWSVQKTSGFTFLSFINTTKYPPSLLFDLLFMGFAALMLYVSEGIDNVVTRILSVYGRVPLFYFVIHLYLIHGLMFIMLFLQGINSSEFQFGPFNNGRPKSGGGIDLWAVYLVWAAVVAGLYPLCKWYGKYKAEHRDNPVLRYL